MSTSNNNPILSPNGKKLVKNINWSKDINAIRRIEVDNIRGQNSNINNVAALTSPIDTTTTRHTQNRVDLFFVRKRMIHLMDLWNRILNCGIFLSWDTKVRAGGWNAYYKSIGANINNFFIDYLFKDHNSTGTTYPMTTEPEKIGFRIAKFLKASILVYDGYLSDGTITGSHFKICTPTSYDYFINSNFIPDANFLNLMEELTELFKSLISETKLFSVLNLNHSDLYFTQDIPRANLLTLCNYVTSATQFTNLIKVNDFLIGKNKSQLIPSQQERLYPQFCNAMARNVSNEPWNIRNILIDTTNKKESVILPNTIGLTQLEMLKPIVVTQQQYIEWEDPMDQPYVMIYCGGTVVNLPDSENRPESNLNLSAFFYKIGTSVKTDPNYNKDDDIKLVMDEDLYEINKFDYFDNLTIYHKID